MPDFCAMFGCVTERNAKTNEKGITFHRQVVILQHLLNLIVTLKDVFYLGGNIGDNHHFSLISLIVSSCHKLRHTPHSKSPNAVTTEWSFKKTSM